MKSFFFRNEELPKKAVALSIFFTIMGIVLICLSFYEPVKQVDPFKGNLFFGAGLIIFIPGIYSLVRIFQAYREDDEEERNTILREIPEM